MIGGSAPLVLATKSVPASLQIACEPGLDRDNEGVAVRLRVRYGDDSEPAPRLKAPDASLPTVTPRHRRLRNAGWARRPRAQKVA